MIAYAGSKAGFAHLYPAPRHATIIEPFAGGAGYALQYADRDVVLYETDPVIVGIWRYLIGVPEGELRALPDVEPGQDLRDLDVPDAARHLIGFWCTKGGRARGNQTAPRWGWMSQRPRWFWGRERREQIASNLWRIRHWRVVEEDWSRAVRDHGDRTDVTWFIDPPYTDVGRRTYTRWRVGYDMLAHAIREDIASDDVIVCEGPGAEWLPFARLDPEAPRNRSSREIALGKERVWTKSPASV